MNKNDPERPPYQALLLNKVNALRARNVLEESRRRGENEGALADRTWVISDGTAGMLAQGLAPNKSDEDSSRRYQSCPHTPAMPFQNWPTCQVGS